MTPAKEKNDMTLFEKQVLGLGYKYIVGIDEAGRGPLAGPVVAAACYIPDGVVLEGITDSKLLSEQKRAHFHRKIVEHPDIKVGIGIVEPAIIDSINILQATMQAMLMAVVNLPLEAEYLLVDGNHYPQTSLPGMTLVKGDQRSQSIAAASIVAKESRDALMRELHKAHPQYGFDTNKGYGTKEHIMTIKLYGPSKVHRKSFEPIKSLIGI